MNDDFDEFEKEMRVIRPRELSAGFLVRFQQKTRSVEASRRLLKRLGVAAAVAVFLAVDFVGVHIKLDRRSPLPLRLTPVLTPVASESVPTPTFGEFEIALAQSPQALDNLMDRQAPDTGAQRAPEMGAVIFLNNNEPLDRSKRDAP